MYCSYYCCSTETVFLLDTLVTVKVWTLLLNARHHAQARFCGWALWSWFAPTTEHPSSLQPTRQVLHFTPHYSHPIKR